MSNINNNNSQFTVIDDFYQNTIIYFENLLNELTVNNLGTSDLNFLQKTIGNFTSFIKSDYQFYKDKENTGVSKIENEINLLNSELMELDSLLSNNLINETRYNLLSRAINDSINLSLVELQKLTSDNLENNVKLLSTALDKYCNNENIINLLNRIDSKDKLFVIANVDNSKINFSVSIKSPQVKFALANNLKANSNYIIEKSGVSIGKIAVDSDYNSTFYDMSGTLYKSPSAFVKNYDLAEFKRNTTYADKLPNKVIRENSYQIFNKIDSEFSEVLYYINEKGHKIYFRTRGYDSLKRGTKFILDNSL